jgi:hypothetical protein
MRIRILILFAISGLFTYSPPSSAQENIPVVWLTCTQATPCASSFTTIFTTTVTTLYRLSASIACTTSTATATAILAIKYNDPSNTVQTITLATATCTTLGVASVANTLQTLNILTGTNVQYSVTTANSPQYQARISLVREGLN